MYYDSSYLFTTLIHKLVIVLRKKYFITVLLYFNKSV